MPLRSTLAATLVLAAVTPLDAEAQGNPQPMPTVELPAELDRILRGYEVTPAAAYGLIMSNRLEGARPTPPAPSTPQA